MNRNAVFIPSAIAFAITLSSPTAFAAGFQLNSQSATGLGRAFAGDAVIADNASVMSRNPAAMTLLNGTEVTFGGVAIDTDVKVKNGNYSNVAGSVNNITTQQIGGTSFVPNVFVAHPVNQQLTVGAGIYSNFGTKTEFAEDYVASEFGGLTDLKTVNFGLSAAYRLNDALSLGIGIDIITGTGKINRSKNIFGNNLALVDIDAEGTGFGWNAGIVYELNDKNRFGFSYRYSPDIEAEGKIQQIGNQLPGKLVMKLPDIAEFSGYHQVHEKIAVHYSVQYIEWSAFDTLSTTENKEIKAYNWKDGWHYSLGMTYAWNEKLTIRSGYMYDTSAQDQLTSISVPDSDRQWLSAGLSYHISENSDIDFGFTYLLGESTDVEENIDLGPAPSKVTGTTHANAYLYGLQYTYRF